jgi:hypothetical protein
MHQTLVEPKVLSQEKLVLRPRNSSKRGRVFFGSVGQKAGVTEAPVCVRHAAGIKSAEKLLGIQSQRLFSIPGHPFLLLLSLPPSRAGNAELGDTVYRRAIRQTVDAKVAVQSENPSHSQPFGQHDE